MPGTVERRMREVTAGETHPLRFCRKHWVTGVCGVGIYKHFM